MNKLQQRIGNEQQGLDALTQEREKLEVLLAQTKEREERQKTQICELKKIEKPWTEAEAHFLEIPPDFQPEWFEDMFFRMPPQVQKAIAEIIATSEGNGHQKEVSSTLEAIAPETNGHQKEVSGTLEAIAPETNGHQSNNGGEKLEVLEAIAAAEKKSPSSMTEETEKAIAPQKKNSTPAP